jgi:branched-chain amino acid transport system substrate-binding protein
MTVDRPVVAVAGPLTGPAAALGQEMAQAAQLALSDSPARERVALELHDDRGDLATGIELAQRLAERPEVVAVVGHYNSDITLEAAPIYAEAGLVMMTPIVSNPALTERRLPGIFRYTNRDDRTAQAIVRHLRDELGRRRALVVETRTTYGSSMSTQFVRHFERAGGRVPFFLSVTEGTTEFSRLLAGVDWSDVDVVFYGGTFEGAPLLAHLRKKGVDHLFATGDGCWDVRNFLRPAGPAADAGEGVLVLSATPELGTVPGATEAAQRYAERFGPIGNYAINSYDSTTVVLAAVLETGASGRDAALAEAVRSVRPKQVAYPAPANWDQNGDNLSATTSLHVARDGRFHQVATYAQ